MQYGLSCAPIIPQAPALKEKLATLPPGARTRLEMKIGTCIAKKRADLEAAEAARAEDALAAAYYAMNTCPSLGHEEQCYRDHAKEIEAQYRPPAPTASPRGAAAPKLGSTVALVLAGGILGLAARRFI